MRRTGMECDARRSESARPSRHPFGRHEGSFTTSQVTPFFFSIGDGFQSMLRARKASIASCDSCNALAQVGKDQAGLPANPWRQALISSYMNMDLMFNLTNQNNLSDVMSVDGQKLQGFIFILFLAMSKLSTLKKSSDFRAQLL